MGLGGQIDCPVGGCEKRQNTEISRGGRQTLLIQGDEEGGAWGTCVQSGGRLRVAGGRGGSSLRHVSGRGAITFLL